MQEAESVTDELKENDQMTWIKAMNSIHNRAEEIVLRELIYGEDVITSLCVIKWKLIIRKIRTQKT